MVEKLQAIHPLTDCSGGNGWVRTPTNVKTPLEIKTVEKFFVDIRGVPFFTMVSDLFLTGWLGLYISCKRDIQSNALEC